MDNELWEVLQSFKAAIDMCLDRIGQLDKMYEDYRNQTDERVHDLESTLYDEIINPTQDYINETNRNARFDDFNSKYGEQLGSYNDALRTLEGEDFDLTKSAFDKYDELDEESRPDEEEYVQAILEEVGSQLDALKRGLGLPSDAEIEVKQTEDGETVVEVEDEGETGEEEIASTEDDIEDEEKNVEAPEEDEEDDPEEIAAFEEELRKQA